MRAVLAPMASSARALVVGGGNLGGALRKKLETRGVQVQTASRSSQEVKLDLSSRSSVLSLDEQLGPAAIDHVIVCCGSSTFGSLENFDHASWEQSVSGKLLSVSQFVIALVKELKFLKNEGSITITTGQAADTINRAWPGIAVNNAGLNAFVRNAGLDLPRGIRLNACSPCLVTETAEKAGLPTESTVKADDAADVYMELVFGSGTAEVREAGTQTAFKRKEEGLAKTSNM